MLKRFTLGMLLALYFTSLATPSQAEDQKSPVSAFQDTLDSALLELSARGNKEQPKDTPKPHKQARVCRDPLDGRVIACNLDGSWWDAGRECYVSLVSPQPDFSHSAWRGNTEGVILACERLHLGSLNNYMFWMPNPNPAPNPVDLAEEAIAQMNLSAIRIGLVPRSLEHSPDAMAVVGEHIWMWADSPDEHTWGPITRSVSAAGHTVTATARVSHITWDMGEKKKVTCRSPGTRWTKARGSSKSPTCGYIYQKQGEHQIRATSHWVIAWSGAGQRGVINLDLTAQAHHLVGEIQVLNTRKPQR